MQLDGRRGGGAQHILEWGVFGFAFGRKAGVLLLEDGQSQHIAEKERKNKRNKQEVSTDNMREKTIKKESSFKVPMSCFIWPSEVVNWLQTLI